jgi:hypothetical protein
MEQADSSNNASYLRWQNLRRDTTILAEIFRGFPRSFQASAWTVS